MLVELLVVISIIAQLVGIVLFVVNCALGGYEVKHPPERRWEAEIGCSPTRASQL